MSLKTDFPREYRSWSMARNRCLNPRAEHYDEYGGRGITFCVAWDSFEQFLMDMGPRPPNTSLDRKKNELGYNPTNCRWATRHQQAQNRRYCYDVTIGDETKNRSDWCRQYGISLTTVRHRVERSGVSWATAISTPVGEFHG